MNLAFTAFIKTKGYTTKGALADACGMDRTVFCDRCRSRSQWLWKEVCTVCSVLDISLDDLPPTSPPPPSAGQPPSSPNPTANSWPTRWKPPSPSCAAKPDDKKRCRPARPNTERQRKDIANEPTFIIRAKRQVVKLALTADLVLLLAALGSMNIPVTILALLAMNPLCGNLLEATR